MSLIRCNCDRTWDSDEDENCPRCDALDDDVALAKLMLGADVEFPATREEAHVLEVLA